MSVTSLSLATSATFSGYAGRRGRVDEPDQLQLDRSDGCAAKAGYSEPVSR